MRKLIALVSFLCLIFTTGAQQKESKLFPYSYAIEDQFVKNIPSPIKYNSPKPKEIMDEDKTIEAYKINVSPENVVVSPADHVFE